MSLNQFNLPEADCADSHSIKLETNRWCSWMGDIACLPVCL